MAKRPRSAHTVGISSSPHWHPAGGDSVWWRHYGDASDYLYRQCLRKLGSEGSTPCCKLYNLHASQGVFRLPSCCRASAAYPTERARTGQSDCKCKRVAIFDLDGTLITTRSGKKFPINANDWKLLYETQVPAQLRYLHDEGYILFILSNQLGVARGHVTLLDMTSKMDDIQRTLQVPLTGCLCCCDDLYRKPRPTGAALLFQELLPRVIQIAQSGSVGVGGDGECRSGLENVKCKYPPIFFVGDAAGRPGDHSSADLKFALNAHMHFFTPEEFFLGKAAPPLPLLLRRFQPAGSVGSASKEPKAKEQWLIRKDGKLRRHTTTVGTVGAFLDPSELLKRIASVECCQMPNGKLGEAGDMLPSEAGEMLQVQQPVQEFVVLVGAPGSGKSTFAERLLPNHAVVRQDDLKGKAKCVELCIRLLKEGKSVVVDRQNATRKERQLFIDLARQHAPGCSVRGVALLWPKELCLHLGQFRSLAAVLRSRRIAVSAGSKEEVSLSDARYRPGKVPKVVVDMFYARVEHPTVDEGFESVQIYQDISKDFLLHDDFCSGDERDLFGSFLD